MRSTSYIGVFLCLVWLSPNGNTQSIMTLEQAMSLAIAQNEEIQIAKLNEDVFAKQVYKANAGMTPRVDWNVNAGTSFNRVNQEFVDGRIIKRNGRTIFPNTNVTAQYTIYDGGQMQNRFKLLQTNARAQRNTTDAIQDNIITLVVEQYTTIQRQKAYLTFLQTNLANYQERLRIVNQRWELGKIAKPEVLQSQIDLNTQTNLIQVAIAELTDMKGQLNATLYRPYETPFEVENLEEKSSLTTIDEVINRIQQNDENLRAFDDDMLMLNIDKDILSGQKKPRIGLQTSLGYNLNNTNAGLILLNQSAGVTAALTATWNLWDGGHIKRQKEIIDLRYNIVQRQKSAYLTTIKSRAQSALSRLKVAQQVSASYADNLAIAKENLDIVLEKLKLGSTTPLEVSDAQQRYNLAGQALINSQFDILSAHWVIERMVE